MAVETLFPQLTARVRLRSGDKLGNGFGSLFYREGKDSALIIGDSARVLARLPDSAFQTCVTSPPYWSLRDYGITGQIGLEESLDGYIRSLVKVFEQVRRVLREDGTLWLNIGDSYTSGGRTWRAPDKKNPGRAMDIRPPTPKGLKPKDLVGVPWRLAFALQSAGWYLRTDIVWNKPNCQPESVKDQRVLARAGIRDEHVFPVPAVLEARPTLVGYYRLLLGAPRKRFYSRDTALGLFQSMETKGLASKRQREALPGFCRAMALELSALVAQISPEITPRDVAELPLLTLGALLQGANNVKIGEEAKSQVFVRVREIVKSHVRQEQSNRLTLANSAGRTLTIAFSADPDILIREETPTGPRNIVAIEIKGGSDASNA